MARSNRVGGKPAGPETDEALVAAAAGGDSGAFERLVDRHVGVLRAACASVTVDPLEREDALQVALVDLWRGCPGFRGESKVSTWMYSIARFASLRVVRHRWPSQVTVTDDVPELGRAAGGWEDLSSSRQVVLNAIAALPGDQREALLLHLEAGMKYEDIAELKIVALGTVKAWVHRARASIRRALDEADHA